MTTIQELARAVLDGSARWADAQKLAELALAEPEVPLDAERLARIRWEHICGRGGAFARVPFVNLTADSKEDAVAGMRAALLALRAAMGSEAAAKAYRKAAYPFAQQDLAPSFHYYNGVAAAFDAACKAAEPADDEAAKLRAEVERLTLERDTYKANTKAYRALELTPTTVEALAQVYRVAWTHEAQDGDGNAAACEAGAEAVARRIFAALLSQEALRAAMVVDGRTPEQQTLSSIRAAIAAAVKGLDAEPRPATGERFVLPPPNYCESKIDCVQRGMLAIEAEINRLRDEMRGAK